MTPTHQLDWTATVKVNQRNAKKKPGKKKPAKKTQTKKKRKKAGRPPKPKLCGAKLRNLRDKCKNKAGAKTDHPGTGRCWMHGGSAGAPAGNQNNQKFGLSKKHLFPMYLEPKLQWIGEHVDKAFKEADDIFYLQEVIQQQIQYANRALLEVEVRFADAMASRASKTAKASAEALRNRRRAEWHNRLVKLGYLYASCIDTIKRHGLEDKGRIHQLQIVPPEGHVLVSVVPGQLPFDSSNAFLAKLDALSRGEDGEDQQTDDIDD